MNTMSTGKKIIAGTIVFLLIAHVLHYGLYSLNENHRFGRELYQKTCRLQNQSKCLADCIDYLEHELPNVDYDFDRLNRTYISLLDNSLIRAYFGWVGSDLCVQYSDKIRDLFRLGVNDPNYQHLRRSFADEEKRNEFVLLKNQLYALCDSLEKFKCYYDQMSEWDRYFTSWEDEQIKLTETIRLP